MKAHAAENARMLASLLDLPEGEAAELLEIRIGITADPSPEAESLATHLRNMLSRTVSEVHGPGSDPRTWRAEIVIGATAPSTAEFVRVTIDSDQIWIGPDAPCRSIPSKVHNLVLLLAACYTAAAAMRSALGGRLTVPGPSALDTYSVSLEPFLGSDPSWLEVSLDLRDTYLAGAGAVGNGFLYALQFLRVRGTLTLADPDVVSGGNLNRCILFCEDDIDLAKAYRLAFRAQPLLPSLLLIPKQQTLQQLGKDLNDDRWLHRLIVGVDSRRTRRRLQGELPNEVFDASTTGVEEIVLHHHRQVTESACLACIYAETIDEVAHERHVADALGVSLLEVQQHLVSPIAAAKIAAKYPQLDATLIVGQAFDSLFKSLCGQAALRTHEDRQVLAPFSFVSVLAGACLAIEVGRRLAGGLTAAPYNYWRVSPWAPPVAALQQMRPRAPSCDFCSVASNRSVTRGLWGG